MPHALQIPRWVFPGINGSVFGFTFWTVCTARTGQFKAVDPQYEQKIRGTQAWFYQSSGTTGVDDAGSTVATQWPTSMQYQVAFLDLSDCGALTGCRPCPTPDMTYMALMALRETTEDLTEFTSGRCRYD